MSEIPTPESFEIAFDKTMQRINACSKACAGVCNEELAIMPYAELKRLYCELIIEVSGKYPEETRHQTALRYIREREGPCEPQQAGDSGGGK